MADEETSQPAPQPVSDSIPQIETIVFIDTRASSMSNKAEVSLPIIVKSDGD